MASTTQTTRLFGIAGQQKYGHDAGLVVTAVTVNGTAATYTDVNDVITISSPTIAGGETILVTGTETPVTVAADIADGSWTAYTPTVTWLGVAPTAYTLTAAYKQIGSKTYAVRLFLNITTLGSGSGSVTFTIPSGLSLPTGSNQGCPAASATTGAPCGSVTQPGNGTILLAFPAGMAANIYVIGTGPFEVK